MMDGYCEERVEADSRKGPDDGKHATGRRDGEGPPAMNEKVNGCGHTEGDIRPEIGIHHPGEFEEKSGSDKGANLENITEPGEEAGALDLAIGEENRPDEVESGQRADHKNQQGCHEANRERAKPRIRDLPFTESRAHEEQQEER